MKLRNHTLITGLLLAYAGGAFAAVTPEEARKLTSTLTAVGAEKAGNQEGTIPAYTGGLTTSPASYKKGSGLRPDPFAGEKPLFSITAQNMDRYAGRLDEASKALLKRYPTYRLDVYPTHRTAAFPAYSLEATARSAVSAQTVNDGLAIRDFKGGVPFPMPKDGHEAIWNHIIKPRGEAAEAHYSTYNVDASGRNALTSTINIFEEWPVQFKQNPTFETCYRIKAEYLAPARRVGEAQLVLDPLNMAEKQRRAWQYLPGQRRVKMAPEIAFDTPNPAQAGMNTYDDAFLFNGSQERYNWKLVGKQELYVPYNTYKLLYEVPSDTFCGPKHLNPDCVRWELHRVWVVEATLKPGKRHIYSKRRFYLDEDSWGIMTTVMYDGRGQLFRSIHCTTVQDYDYPVPNTEGYWSYDLIAGTYNTGMSFEGKGYYRHTHAYPERMWSPEALAGVGIR